MDAKPVEDGEDEEDEIEDWECTRVHVENRQFVDSFRNGPILCDYVTDKNI